MSSIRTTSSSSTTIDDDLSLMVHDSSETTVATQTSRSWHSVRSDLPLNNHLFIRSPMINYWLTRCSIEPDIRLTTAQEWKLRTCLRRFILLCNHSLRFVWVKEKQSDRKEIFVFRFFFISLTDLIQDFPHSIDKEFAESGQFLSLIFNLSSSDDEHPISLDVNLMEFNRNSTSKATSMSLIKPIRFVFHVVSNILKISLRTCQSLVEFGLLTRENEAIRGTFYKWNENVDRQTFQIEIN